VDEYEWKILSSNTGNQDRSAYTPTTWEYKPDDIEDLIIPPADAVVEKPSVPREVPKAEKKRHTSGCYRVLLWASVCVAVIALAMVTYVEIQKNEDAPESRADALNKLDRWLFDNGLAASNYLTALNGPTLDCKAIREDDQYKLPERPEWAGSDNEYQEGLDEFFTLLDNVERNLQETHRRIEAVCNGKDQVANEAWPRDGALALANDAENDALRASTLLQAERETLTPEAP
jgi:hypothetical protein